MVVHLGASGVEVVNSQRYRIKQGQTLSLRYVASHNVVTVRAWARVRYDNGEDDLLFIPDFTTSNDPIVVALADTLGEVARMDGWVVDALVELPLDLDVRRGEVYVSLFMSPFGPVLCSDYCYSSFGQVSLGTYIPPGPAGGSGFHRLISDVTSDDSDKVFTVPANTIWRVYSIHVSYTATATVGSRVIRVRFRDTADLPAFESRMGIVLAASSGTDLGFLPAVVRETSVDLNQVLTPFPPEMWLPSGFDIQVFDAGLIDPAADDMTVQIMLEQWVGDTP